MLTTEELCSAARAQTDAPHMALQEVLIVDCWLGPIWSLLTQCQACPGTEQNSVYLLLVMKRYSLYTCISICSFIHYYYYHTNNNNVTMSQYMLQSQYIHQNRNYPRNLVTKEIKQRQITNSQHCVFWTNSQINPEPILTFVHSDFNGSAIWANAVATNTHVGARVGHLDVGDEQSADVGAIHAGLKETHHKVRRLKTYLSDTALWLTWSTVSAVSLTFAEILIVFTS